MPCHAASQRTAALKPAGRGDAEQRNAGPREPPDEVGGARRLGPHAQPGQPTGIEDVGVDQHAGHDERRRAEQDDNDWQAQEQEADERKKRDGVEDAEERKRLAEGDVGADGHRERSGDEDGPSPPERAPADAAAVAERKADADEEQEARKDQPLEGDPARLDRDVDRPEGEVGEVPGEMVGDHRDDRDPTQGIDQRHARPRGGGKGESGHGGGLGRVRQKSESGCVAQPSGWVAGSSPAMTAATWWALPPDTVASSDTFPVNGRGTDCGAEADCGRSAGDLVSGPGQAPLTGKEFGGNWAKTRWFHPGTMSPIAR